jgi:hypothetical protein
MTGPEMVDDRLRWRVVEPGREHHDAVGTRRFVLFRPLDGDDRRLVGDRNHGRDSLLAENIGHDIDHPVALPVREFVELAGDTEQRRCVVAGVGDKPQLALEAVVIYFARFGEGGCYDRAVSWLVRHCHRGSPQPAIPHYRYQCFHPLRNSGSARGGPRRLVAAT